MAVRRHDTTLLGLLRTGHTAEAAQEIWERYSRRVIGLARKKLQDAPRRSADEEDVALSAFNSFFRGAAAGRFPRLEDRHDLWQVLAVLAERKAIDQIRRQQADKRGGGRVRGDSLFVNADGSSADCGLAQLAESDPGPELVAAFADECRRLFDALEDPELRIVALLKLEGFTTEQIARSLERAPRSIERKLNAIRKVWKQPESG